MNSLVSTLTTPPRRALEPKQKSAPLDRALRESTSQRVIEINSLEQLQQLQRCTRETLEEQFGRHAKITLRTHDPLIADHIRKLQAISGRTLSVTERPKETPSTHPTLAHTVASEGERHADWQEKTEEIDDLEARMSTVFDKIDLKIASGTDVIKLRMQSLAGLTGTNVTRLRDLLDKGHVVLNEKESSAEAKQFIASLQRLNAEQHQSNGHARKNGKTNGTNGHNGHNGKQNGHAGPRFNEDAIVQMLQEKSQPTIPVPLSPAPDIYRLVDEESPPKENGQVDWNQLFAQNGQSHAQKPAAVPLVAQKQQVEPLVQPKSAWKKVGGWLRSWVR